MTEISRVVPAVLTDDPESLRTMVRLAEGFSDYVQFDIMDGSFVPSRSIGWEHLANLSMQLRWEAHLMVFQPEDYLADFQQAGAKRVFFHYEATDAHQKIISLARELGLEIGLALNPETPTAAILPLIADLDSILFMSVNPGFYGAKFIPEVLDKITEFRKIYPDVEIGIDGGIKEDNIKLIAQNGVDCIYVGSAIFLQPQPGESFRRLSALAQEGSQKKPVSKQIPE
jgi:ribulose-phosphate 3-epimerase